MSDQINDDRQFVDFLKCSTPLPIANSETYKVDIENNNIIEMAPENNQTQKTLNQSIIGSIREALSPIGDDEGRDVAGDFGSFLERDDFTPQQPNSQLDDCNGLLLLASAATCPDPGHATETAASATPDTKSTIIAPKDDSAAGTNSQRPLGVNENNGFNMEHISHCQNQSFHPHVINCQVDTTGTSIGCGQQQRVYHRTSTPAANNPLSVPSTIDQTSPFYSSTYQSPLNTQSAADQRTQRPFCNTAYQSPLGTQPAAVQPTPPPFYSSTFPQECASAQEDDMDNMYLRAKVVASSVAPKHQIFSPEQRRILGEEFVRSPKCPRDRKMTLSSRLGLMPQAVSKYFKIARTKLKRVTKRSYAMEPPKATTSPVRLQSYSCLPTTPTVPTFNSTGGQSVPFPTRSLHPQLTAHLDRVIPTGFHQRDSAMHSYDVPSTKQCAYTDQQRAVITEKRAQTNVMSQSGGQQLLPTGNAVGSEAEPVATAESSAPSGLWQPFKSPAKSKRKSTTPRKSKQKPSVEPMELSSPDMKHAAPVVIEPQSQLQKDESLMDVSNSHHNIESRSHSLASASAQYFPGCQQPSQQQFINPAEHFANTTSNFPATATAFQQASDRNSVSSLPTWDHMGSQPTFHHQRQTTPHVPNPYLHPTYYGASSVQGMQNAQYMNAMFAQYPWAFPVQGQGQTYTHAQLLPSWHGQQPEEPLHSAGDDTWKETCL